MRLSGIAIAPVLPILNHIGLSAVADWAKSISSHSEPSGKATAEKRAAGESPVCGPGGEKSLSGAIIS
jgi:hypothetical protein